MLQGYVPTVRGPVYGDGTEELIADQTLSHGPKMWQVY